MDFECVIFVCNPNLQALGCVHFEPLWRSGHTCHDLETTYHKRPLTEATMKLIA